MATVELFVTTDILDKRYGIQVEGGRKQDSIQFLSHSIISVNFVYKISSDKISSCQEIQTASPNKMESSTVDFPLTEMHNCCFCIDTELIKMNRQAIDHTRLLSNAATKIARFWQSHHNWDGVIYDGESARKYNYHLTGAFMYKHSADAVIRVKLEHLGLKKIHMQDQILQETAQLIANHITHWYSNIYPVREDVCIPYNRNVLVGILTPTKSSPYHFKVRYPILAEYLIHNSFWAGAKCKNLLLGAFLFVKHNPFNIKVYPERIHRSAAAYLLHNFPTGCFDSNSLPRGLSNYLENGELP